MDSGLVGVSQTFSLGPLLVEVSVCICKPLGLELLFLAHGIHKGYPQHLRTLKLLPG